MSATGRNLVGHERHPDDFFTTPAWCTRAIVRHLDLQAADVIVEPCCGEGAILKVLSEEFDGIDFTVFGIEIDEGRAATAKRAGFEVDTGDALTHERWDQSVNGRVTHVITNPPYKLAMEFVEKALVEVVSLGGTAAFLLRLNWLASQGRADFHRKHPCDVYVLPRRPSFAHSGKTDATEYCWMVWRKNGGGRWQILDVEGSR